MASVKTEKAVGETTVVREVEYLEVVTLEMAATKEAAHSIGFEVFTSTENMRIFPRGNMVFLMKDLIGDVKKIRVTIEEICE